MCSSYARLDFVPTVYALTTMYALREDARGDCGDRHVDVNVGEHAASNAASKALSVDCKIVINPNYAALAWTLAMNCSS